jgi:CRISPR-associated protein Cas2
MSNERLFIVTYDISDPKRWRRVFRIMKGYGEWLQLSVFQCRLSARRRAELQALLDSAINHAHDHVILLDLGDAESIKPRVISLGKVFVPISRETIIV